MNKQKVTRFRNFIIKTFQDYKEMHDFIMSLNLENEDNLWINDDDYSFTYGKDVSWLEEETDNEYEQRIKEKEIIKEEKYKEYLKLKQEFEGENNG